MAFVNLKLGDNAFCFSSFYKLQNDARFEIFTALMFQVEVFCIVTPCGFVVGYQRHRGLCCLHLQGEGGSMDL